MVTLTYSTSVQPFSGGVTSTPSYGPTWQVTIGGSWNAGDTYGFDVSTSSQNFTLGAGRVTQVVPTSALTLANRVHFVAGQSWYGSDNGDATGWEQQAPGAFAIQLSNQWQQPENLNSLAPYQGKIALQSRHTTQIWALNADPTQISLLQTLANIGTFAYNGSQNVGDLDVYFPSDSGLRSLRARDLTLNAFVADVGSPVDALVNGMINNQSASYLLGSLSVVEPSAQRYWSYIRPPEIVPTLVSYGSVAHVVSGTSYYVYPITGLDINKTYFWLPGTYDWGIMDANYNPLSLNRTSSPNGAAFQPTTSTIYLTSKTPSVSVTASIKWYSFFVLSAFPAGKIIAWSQYQCLCGGNVFIPQRLLLVSSQVYIRASINGSDYIITHGKNANTPSTYTTDYDSVQAVMQTAFFDVKKPGHQKQAQALDVDVVGPVGWGVTLTEDWPNNTQLNVISSTGSAPTIPQATFDKGWLQVQARGTHFSVTFKSYSNAGDIPNSYQPGAIASAVLYFDVAEAPVGD